MGFADAQGFMFDLDGTLVHRSPDGVEPIPGATALIERIRGSGRPLVVFTNATHVTPATIAAGVREGGLQIADNEVLTPLCSAIRHLMEQHAGQRALVLGTEPVLESIRAAGIDVVDAREAASADVVVVMHIDQADLAVLEGAARAVHGGAALLTGNYARAYAGATGPIISRGAMLAAAVAKGGGREPTVVGKPSRAAVNEMSATLGVAPGDIAVVGDDVDMDIALGKLGGCHTVLVRTGMSQMTLEDVPATARPDEVVSGVKELLSRL